MKTFTFIMYFVAILGLIEADWRVVYTKNFNRNDVDRFLPLARTAFSRLGNDFHYLDDWLTIKMEQNWPGRGCLRNWNCFIGYNFAGRYVAGNVVHIRNGYYDILCFGSGHCGPC